MKLVCVIGDIVGSRTIDDRRAFQQRLYKTLAHVSANHPHLCSPYTITLGDEFQAVYKAADRLFCDFAFIQQAVYPSQVRFAIGVGKLTTAINSVQAIGMDGPAFHRAREAMMSLKKNASLFRVSLEDNVPHRWTDAALDLVSHVESTWRKNRLRILSELLLGHDAKSIAHKVKLTPAAVYKNIQAGPLQPIVRLYAEIAGLINSTLK